jgi:hypothetical protein
LHNGEIRLSFYHPREITKPTTVSSGGKGVSTWSFGMSQGRFSNYSLRESLAYSMLVMSLPSSAHAGRGAAINRERERKWE